MKYNINDCYLINDYNKEINLKKYIVKIIQINEDQSTILKIFIFPESTKNGRLPFIGKNEVYSTTKEISCKFKCENSTKIELIDFDRYISLKLSNKQIGNDIYYYRQSYSFETNRFTPERLPLICYCKKILNPDKPFKQCICGNYFHIGCFIKVKTNECWSENCHYNCNNFLDISQQIKKLANMSDINEVNNEINMKKQTSFQPNSKKSFYSYEYNNELLNQKTKRKEFENKKLDNTNLNLSNKSTSITSNKSKEDKKETILNIPKKAKSQIIGNTNRSQEQINREKGQSIIYKVLSEGYNLMENNHSFKRQYDLSDLKNKITNTNLTTFTNQIEENLFFLYKSNPSSYKNYLQEFNKLKKDSLDLLLKIISGHYSPRDISNFKGDDFLSDEKKKEKEQHKKSVIEKMKYKHEDDKIQFEMAKGNLLSGNEVYIENNNENENMNLNLTRLNSSDILLEKQKQFPNLKPQDIKHLIELETPNKNNIKNRIEQAIRKNLDINTINYFMDKRKKILTKKSRNILIQKMKKENSEFNKENIENIPEYNKKINENIDNISFGNLNVKLLI